jgi:hypothetical protein
MSTRVVDIEKPYEWGTAIEVTQDKVINLRLRSENNLIIYDEGDNEIYVDLQLPSDIEPADAIPVWINTGRVLAADWWDYTGTIVVFKTTSWDNIKLLYADNGRVFIDNWTGTFKEIYLKWDVDALILGLRNYINDELAKKQDKLTAWANITIQEDPQTHELVISSTGWGWASYTAWTGIDIDANNVISVDSTYMAWYIPRCNAISPDNLANSVLYYGECLNQWVTTALGLATDQVMVRADIDEQNSNRAYLEYYNWAVDLYLSNNVSGTRTTAMYKSTGIESTAGWTTETFEFQWTWNNKIARLSDLDDKQDKLTAWDNITIEEVSLFDTQWPAPDGFHVPTKNEWQEVLTMWQTINARADWTSSWWEELRTYLKLPCQSYRASGSWDIQAYTNYLVYMWCSTPLNEYWDALKIWVASPSTFLPKYSFTSSLWRWFWCPIRAFKNVPVIPDNTWTTIYDWSSTATNAGIFHNSTLWLISISSDWINWKTISDKNIWATAVRSSWNITDNQKWYFYQRWNNYWFPSTWSVATSSTQVDASANWPWRYYNSSTFITNSNWDSSNNWNLWWWVSQWQWDSLVISVDSSTVALKSDLSSYIKTWSNAVSSAGSGVELRHTTDSSNYEYVKVAPNRISASVCENWAVTQYSYYLTWTSNNRIAKISDINSAVSVVSWDSNTYSIVVSNSAPASWTPNTTLTFVV